MALNPKTSVAARNLALDAAINSVGASGLMRWYDGTQPADADTAITSQVKLAELPLSATGFSAASAGSKAANAITSAAALATSTATWGTICTSGGTRVMDYSIGTSGANLNLNAVAIVTSATCSCSSFTVTQAA